MSNLRPLIDVLDYHANQLRGMSLLISRLSNEATHGRRIWLDGVDDIAQNMERLAGSIDIELDRLKRAPDVDV